MKEIARFIAGYFKYNNWSWKLTQDRVVPTEEDVTKVIDKATSMLYSEAVGTQLSVGRLIIRKEDKTMDVYMFVGELPYSHDIQ